MFYSSEALTPPKSMSIRSFASNNGLSATGTVTGTGTGGHRLDTNPIIYGTAWKKDSTKKLVIAAVEAG